MPGEFENDLVTIAQMSARDLAIERQRLIDALLGNARPHDAFERVAILEEYRADPGNQIAVKLIQVEEALRSVGAELKERE